MSLAFLSIKTSLEITLMVLGIIILALLVGVVFYILASVRRLSITLKKVDILVEDITYKSSMLDPTFNLVGKVTGHLDTLEAFSKNSLPSYLKALYTNQNTVFKIIDEFKEKSHLFKNQKKDSKKRNVNVEDDHDYKSTNASTKDLSSPSKEKSSSKAKK